MVGMSIGEARELLSGAASAVRRQDRRIDSGLLGLGLSHRVWKNQRRLCWVVRSDPGSLGTLTNIMGDVFLGYPVIHEQHPIRRSGSLLHRLTGMLSGGSAKETIFPGSGLRADGVERFGTFGCLVDSRGDRCILTCEHVLTDGISPPALGTQVFTFREDQRGLVLGEILRYGGIREELSDNDVDAALVKVESKTSVSHQIPGVIDLHPEPMDFSKARFGLPVRKVGSCSAETFGEISGVYSIRINYSDGAHARFAAMLEVTPDLKRNDKFCVSGDSGAVLTTFEKRARVLGLLCSHDQSLLCRGYVCPITHVLEKLDASIRV